jgi:cell pole-organizing protein PopZ
MSQKAAKAQEPSMEEILASIRRIISDENGPGEPGQKPAPERPAPPPLASAARPAAPQAREPVPPPPQEPDVLELTDMVETKSEPVFKPVESPDVEFRDQMRKRQELHQETREEPEPLASSALSARAAYPTRLDEQLLSQRASEAVSAAFGTLANTMFAEGSRSIEDVVREMLKPMLKTWLEDNLPSLVERLVRAEIERVARGGR